MANGRRTLLAWVERELIPEVIEADFIGRAIGDVALVSGAAFLAGHVLLHDADRQSESPIDAAHPGGITSRQVVVGGEDVNAQAASREPGNGGNSRHGLAFASLHLDDLAIGQRQRRLHLHVEQLEPQLPGCEHRRGGNDARERCLLLYRLIKLTIRHRGQPALLSPNVIDRRHRARLHTDGSPPCTHGTPLS